MELESSEINKHTTKTVRILRGDNNNSIPDRAFKYYSSLESVQIEDGANVTIIRWDAFRYCKSLQSIKIPIGVTFIGESAFRRCSSLRSMDIPIDVKKIGRWAFLGCKLLQSIHIPNTVETIGYGAFDGCDTLENRLSSGTNYHPDTETWLRQRFDNLPIHQACYYANDNDAESGAVDHLSTLVQQNNQPLTATDAMGMTPLHILCCNRHINVDMVRVIMEKEVKDASVLLAHTDVTGSTPLQLFMRCRGYEQEDEEKYDPWNLFEADEEEDEATLSLHDLLEKGISGEDLSIILFALDSNDNRQFELSLSQDEQTGLFPFMSAASLPACGLDVVYALAMNDFSSIL